MSATYQPVQWNRNKLVYDVVLIVAVLAYLWLFLRIAPEWSDAGPINTPIIRMRAFGSCAFLMLTLVLCIGPLARLDRRFLPLLYNRRHFGVLTFLVALSHVVFVLGWYHVFTPVDSWVSVLSSNANYDQWQGFPFEILGVVALVILFVMAATSHDFWLAFLTPPVWKALHMGVYVAYAAVVMHVVLGALQTQDSLLYPGVVVASVLAVVGLHVAAAVAERRREAAAAAEPADGWLFAAKADDIPDNRAVIVSAPGGERIAVFRYGNKVSALSNVCAHQNGPLGEGRIVFGCVTCPWHGFQYRPEDGCSPPPFTEKVPTYRVRLDGDRVLVDPNALPPGTPVPPIVLAEAPA